MVTVYISKNAVRFCINLLLLKEVIDTNRGKAFESMNSKVVERFPPLKKAKRKKNVSSSYVTRRKSVCLTKKMGGLILKSIVRKDRV